MFHPRPLWIAIAIGLATPALAEGRRLSIVLVLIDDMGWTDLGCYGGKHCETPHLDKLATDEMRFGQAYSACIVCSQTRAEIVPCKYPARLPVSNRISWHSRSHTRVETSTWSREPPLEEETLAGLLKTAGKRKRTVSWTRSLEVI